MGKSTDIANNLTVSSDRNPSFDELLLEHLDLLFAVGMKLTRNADDAEDLVNNTIVKALRFHDKFKEGTYIKAWLLTILRNTYINQYRQRVRRPSEVELSGTEEFNVAYPDPKLRYVPKSEGYTDVISMFQSGVTNVVSSSGTSLTREQVRLVKRYTQNLTILYDGDAAGIKASFRGIDLILEEGLNVQVVLFPDGEDPDSFAKNHSLAEIQEMISENKQDFISFKASVLIDGTDNDPIQRSKLIREVVQSVALIPDQITRSVYVQEIAKKFEINEQTISNELIKLLRAKLTKDQQGAKSYQEQRTTHQPAVIQPSAEKKDETSTFEYELDLIRLMLLFGTREIIISADDDEEKETTSVIELIHDELTNDDLEFESPLYRMIYKEFESNLQNQVLLSTSYFKNLENQKIVSFVSHLQSSDIELSYNWREKYNIIIQSESDDIYKSVMNSVYNFKYHKVDEMILKIKNKIKEGGNEGDGVLELLAEQMSFEKIKQRLSEMLGRIIIK